MKSRDTLLKLYRFRADEAKAKLAGLEAMRADLFRRMSELDHLLSDEQRRATEAEIGRYAYPTFARSVLARKENVQRSVEAIERQIEKAREELQAAFEELKRFEIAEEARQRREAEELAARTQRDSDERVIQRFQRLKGETRL